MKSDLKTLRMFDENPHPEYLYTLDQVAAYAGRTGQLLRMYYSQGLLPEPRHSIKHAKKTTRKFTLQEAKQIRAFFVTMTHGSIHKARKFKERMEKLNAEDAAKQSQSGTDQ